MFGWFTKTVIIDVSKESIAKSEKIVELMEAELALEEATREMIDMVEEKRELSRRLAQARKALDK